MNVIEQSADRLVLKQRPTLLLVVTGVIVVGLGIVAGVQMLDDVRAGLNAAGVPLVFAIIVSVFIRHNLATFDRRLGRVTIEERSVFGLREEGRALARVAETELQASRRRKSGRTNRVILRLEDGAEVPVTSLYYSGKGPGRTRDVIDAWLARGRAG